MGRERRVAPRSGVRARPLLERMRAASKDGRVVARVGMHGRCETSRRIKRPRPRLVSRLDASTCGRSNGWMPSPQSICAAGMPTGRRSGDGVAAQRAWRAASLAPPMPYAVHWRTFEHALISCDAPAEAPPPAACPRPLLQVADRQAAHPIRREEGRVVSDAPPSGWELGAPPTARSRPSSRARAGWPTRSPGARAGSGMGALCPAEPARRSGIVWLVGTARHRRHARLRLARQRAAAGGGRVVATSDGRAGTRRSRRRARRARRRRRRAATRTAARVRVGPPTRAGVDAVHGRLYLAGLADGFATMLFSSFQASTGSRSRGSPRRTTWRDVRSQQRSSCDAPPALPARDDAKRRTRVARRRRLAQAGIVLFCLPAISWRVDVVPRTSS